MRHRLTLLKRDSFARGRRQATRSSSEGRPVATTVQQGPDAPRSISAVTGATAIAPHSHLVRVSETNANLDGISSDFFQFDGSGASLVLAFVSPHIDFSAVCAKLSGMVGTVPMVAVSTAGELCNAAPRSGSLYRTTGDHWDSVVIEAFGPALIAAVSVHTIPLHNDDIRHGTPRLSRGERVRRIAASLAAVQVPFKIDSRDTLALTFVDGLSACESYLMEAVYKVGQFPCLFIGGSAGGTFDFSRTEVFDGREILQNHAVITFVKLAADKRYGILKSQNFRKTDKSFVTLDADPDRRIVTTVIDQETFTVESTIAAMCRILDCRAAELQERLADHTFGIELGDEIFVRSVSSFDFDKGSVTFYCDVNAGDKLFLLESTDFVEQTRGDYQTFMCDKPPPVAAILNDCILRRLYNEPRLKGLDGLWDCPVAGFSTFGELLGININQTLTAVFFFDVPVGQSFCDPFVDRFPVHYGRFVNYFTSCRLARVKLLNEIRGQTNGQLTDHFADMGHMSEEVTAITMHARLERAQRDSQNRLLAITSTLFEGVLLVALDGDIVFANPSAQRMLGREPLAGCSLDDVMTLQTRGEPITFAHGPFRRVIETGAAAVDDDAVFATADGRRLSIAYAAAQLQEEGKPDAVVISFRDIETLKAAQREALQASRLASVGQLAAGIAHEINTPIQYIGDNLHFIDDALVKLISLAAAGRDLAAAGPGETASRFEDAVKTAKLPFLMEEAPVAIRESLDGVAQIARIVLSMKEFSHPGTSAKTMTD
ncbi:MAG: PAS domain S-box protein, partial [Rhodospirillales bacterium]